MRISAIVLFSAKAVDWLQSYNGAVTAIATVFIGVFTIVLAWVSIRQTIIANRAIKLAREEFIASHRPLINVRAIHLHWPTSTSGTSQIKLLIRNIGSSVATVTRLTVSLSCISSKKGVSPSMVNEGPKPPFDIKVGHKVESNWRVGIDLSNFLFDPSRLLPVEMEPEAVMDLRIIVYYEDVFRARRETSVYRRYDFKLLRFCKVEDSEFDYTD